MKKYFIILSFFIFIYPAYGEEMNDKKAFSLYSDSIYAIEKGDIDKAIDLLKEVIKKKSDYPEAYERLGHLFLKKGFFDDAIESFKNALKMNPNLSSAKTGLGLALIKKEQFKDAEDILKNALLLNPYPSMTHYALGILYEGLSDYKKAIYHFKEGIKKYKVEKMR